MLGVHQQHAGFAGSTGLGQQRRAGSGSRSRSSNRRQRRALAEFTGVSKSELPDEDQSAYNDAAMRVSAVRWDAAHTRP